MPEALTRFWGTYELLLQSLTLQAGVTYGLYLMLLAGRLNVSVVGFTAVGSYSALYVTLRGGSLGLGLLLALAVCGVVAFVVGLPTMRLRGLYFVVITIALALVAQQVAFSLTPITGGYAGLTGIPPLVGWGEALVFMAMCAGLARWCVTHDVGRALRSIEAGDEIAEGLGVDVRSYLLGAFVTGAMIAGVGGGLLAHLFPFIDPNRFGFGAMIDYVAYAVVGGAGHWTAPILGVAVIGFVPEVLRWLGELREIAIGVTLVVVAIFAPWGLGDARAWRWLPFSRRRSVDPVDPDERVSQVPQDEIRDTVGDAP